MVIRHQLDAVLDVSHRRYAGVREGRGKDVAILSNQVPNRGNELSGGALEFLCVSGRRRGGLGDRRSGDGSQKASGPGLRSVGVK
jgi:hypothetical protein